MAFRCKGVEKLADGSTREWDLGTVTFRRGVSGTMASGEVPVEFAAKSLTVVIMADPRAAESSVDITEVWPGEVVVADVAVEDGSSGVRIAPPPR